jgi:SAM-dependent methyltransferase
MSRFGRYQYNLKRFLGKAKWYSFFCLRIRDRAIEIIAGTHPKTNPFHHQWAMNRQLVLFAKRYLSRIPEGSSVLDVGVGSAPYWYLRPDLTWSGLDVNQGEYVDFVIDKDKRWPVPDKSFDFVFCTQVLEHVERPEFTVSEIERVLSPGGLVILNAPFLYPFHGMPEDQARYTTSQLQFLFRNFNVTECGILGGVGSSMATIYLNFINYKISGSVFLQLTKLIFLPLWLLGNGITNLALVSLDKLDNTNSFPLNTYLIATTRQKP